MRNHSKHLLWSGCLFLCLGGWGYNTQAIAADPATGAKLDLTSSPTVLAAPAATSDSSPLNASVVNVAADGTMERVNFSDTDINTVLQFLSKGASKNIVASREVKGNVTAALYNVTLDEALKAILTPLGLGYVEEGKFIYVYSQKELDDMKKRDRKSVNRIFRLHYIAAADAAILIKPMLSATGQVALTPAATSDIPDGQSDSDGYSYSTDDTLVVNDFPDNLLDIEKGLKQMDVRPKQVLIESTILSATIDDTSGLGIDFVSLSGIDFSGLGAGNTLAGVITQAATNVTGAPAGSPLTGPGRSTKGFAGTDPATGGLEVGFLSNSINVFIHALETTNDITIVANPKILAVNKHRGEVFIGHHDGYLTTTVSNNTTVQTVQFLDTGTKLIFRPFIGDDNYVRLEIHPETSDGSVVNIGSSALPTSFSTEVTSNIMVKDGRTVVIGGLFSESTAASRGQVPVIGNIPILGVPFRKTNDETKRNETIVLLTPHIINDDTSMYTESEKRQEDVTRMMLGNRQGLQPWGRDRLAQCWLDDAQNALSAGDHEKALMFTDWALNSRPGMLDAIKLREKLTNKRLEESDESSIHNFVRDTLSDDHNQPVNDGSGHYPATPATFGEPAPAPSTAPAK